MSRDSESVIYGGVLFPGDHTVSLPYRSRDAFFAQLLLKATIEPHESILILDSPYDYHVIALKNENVPVGSIVSYQSDSSLSERIQQCYA